MTCSVLHFHDVDQHPFVQALFQPNIHERTGNFQTVAAQKLAALEQTYLFIAGDQVEFQKARAHIQALTRDKERNPERLELREARLRLLQGHEPNALEETVAWLLDTRRDRWTRLAQTLGCPFPDAFELFRGVHDAESVEYVLEHWLGADDTDDFPVLQHSTASWSLSEQSARVFMGSGLDAVLYRAVVDFDTTFADMLVDDSSFVVPYQRQWEVVAGPVQEGAPLFASKAGTKIRFQGRTYHFVDRHLLAERWSAGQTGFKLNPGGRR